MYITKQDLYGVIAMDRVNHYKDLKIMCDKADEKMDKLVKDNYKLKASVKYWKHKASLSDCNTDEFLEERIKELESADKKKAKKISELHRTVELQKEIIKQLRGVK